MKLLAEADCDLAAARGPHGEDGACARNAPYVRASLRVADRDRYPREVILTPDEVVKHLSSDLHDWGDTTMIERVQDMGLCVAGLCTSPYLTGRAELLDMVALEGLIEQFGGTPGGGGWLDEPRGVLDALATIRSTRNAIQERNRKAQEQTSRG